MSLGNAVELFRSRRELKVILPLEKNFGGYFLDGFLTMGKLLSLPRAVDVEWLAARLLPTPENQGSNPYRGKLL